MPMNNATIGRKTRPEPDQYAALLVFRPGTTREQVAAALNSIAGSFFPRVVPMSAAPSRGPVDFAPRKKNGVPH